MDLAVIEPASKTEAVKKLDEYRAAVKANHDATDQLIMKGYEALAEGKQLIGLRGTMERGGWDENDLPRLAIARMTDERVRVRFDSTQTYFHPPMQYNWQTPVDRAGLNAGVVRLFDWTRPLLREGQQRRVGSGEAIVPLVPPNLRPKLAKNRYFVLFEAEWELIPPKDPALIRHLVGDLWVVLSTWDLTELERAAIAGR